MSDTSGSNPFWGSGATSTSAAPAVTESNPFWSSSSATPNTTNPPAVSNPFWSSTTATPSATQTPAHKSSGGILGTALHYAGLAEKTMTSMGTNLIPGVVGKVAGGVASIPGEAVKEGAKLVASPFEQISNQTLGTHFQTFDTTKPGETYQQQVTRNLNKMPLAGGLLRGAQQTGEEVAHPSRIIKNYSNDPASAALNDIGNLSMVLPPVGEAIKSMAEAAQAARDAGDASKALSIASKAGDVIKAAGELPKTVISAGKGSLVSLANRMAGDPELLYAAAQEIDSARAADFAGPTMDAAAKETSPTKTAFNTLQDLASTPEQKVARSTLSDLAARETDRGTTEALQRPLESPVAAQEQSWESSLNQARQDAVQAVVRHGGITGALARFGETLKPEVQVALNNVTDTMSRLRDVPSTLSPEDQLAQKKAILQAGTLKASRSPIFTRLSDIDKASLVASAKDAGIGLEGKNGLLSRLGFQPATEATHGFVNDPDLYVQKNIGAALEKVTRPFDNEGVIGSTLRGANKLTNTLKLGLSPVTLINRLSHVGLIAGADVETKDALQTAWKAARGKLSGEDLADLANTTKVGHGAIWEAETKVASVDPSRVDQIKKSLMDIPSTVLQKSPFLTAARASDDAIRSGVWLAARHAGASVEDADYILTRDMGVFDRSTPGMRALTKAIPFANWHKQVLLILGRMAENHPLAFTQFTNAASRMTNYNKAQNIYSGNTRFGKQDVNLSFLSPFSATSAALTPAELLSPTLKAAMPSTLGVLPSGKPPSSPTGPVIGNGLNNQSGATGQELINTIPQLKAIQGSQPRYSNGQINPNVQGGGALQTWSTMLGVPIEPASEQAQYTAQANKGKAISNKITASVNKKYNAKVAALP